MIEIALEISLMVLFLHACTWEGQIFAGVKVLVPSRYKISKPIYGCPMCMTPWWGTLIYALVFAGFSHFIGSWGERIKEWIVVVGVASGFSVIWVMAIYVKDYCKSRTRDEDSCC